MQVLKQGTFSFIDIRVGDKKFINSSGFLLIVSVMLTIIIMTTKEKILEEEFIRNALLPVAVVIFPLGFQNQAPETPLKSFAVRHTRSPNSKHHNDYNNNNNDCELFCNKE